MVWYAVWDGPQKQIKRRCHGLMSFLLSRSKQRQNRDIFFPAILLLWPVQLSVFMDSPSSPTTAFVRPGLAEIVSPSWVDPCDISLF